MVLPFRMFLWHGTYRIHVRLNICCHWFEPKAHRRCVGGTSKGRVSLHSLSNGAKSVARELGYCEASATKLLRWHPSFVSWPVVCCLDLDGKVVRTTAASIVADMLLVNVGNCSSPSQPLCTSLETMRRMSMKNVLVQMGEWDDC